MASLAAAWKGSASFGLVCVKLSATIPPSSTTHNAGAMKMEARERICFYVNSRVLVR
jgi:hypothetical protein